MWDIFILNEIRAQGKIYFGTHFSCLKYFTYHLVPVLVQNYKQHILSMVTVTELCYSLVEIYVRSVYLNVFKRKGARRS
jgi:hypothetical protein